MTTTLILAGHGSVLKNGVPTTKGKCKPPYYEGPDNKDAARWLAYWHAIYDKKYEDLIGNTPIDVSLKDRIKTANIYGKDDSILVDLHANAGDKDARGHVVFYYRWSKKSKLLAQCISKRMEEMTSIPSRGIKPSMWMYTIRKSKMVAAMVERYFFTNPEDQELGQKEMREQMRAVFMGIEDYKEQVKEL